MSTKLQLFQKIFSVSTVCIANGLIYGLNALYYCFLQIYLEQHHTPVSVGILLAIGPLVSIFAPILWGIRADKAKYKNNILILTVTGSAIFFFLLMFNQNFWWLFATLLLLMFFMSPFAGLIDIITLEYSAKSNVPFGPLRLVGTLSFGLLPMILTIYTETNINIIFYVYVILAVFCIITLRLMPKVAGHAKGKRKVSIKPVLTDKKLLLIIYIIFISQIAWSYYINFFPTYITGTLGLLQTVWGVNVFVTIIGEIPFFLMFNKIFSKFGIKKMLFFGIIITVIRYTALAMVTTAPTILITAVITGLSPTVLTYCGSVHIINNMNPEIQASAQTFMYAVGGGIPRVLAGVFGGMLTNAFGVKITMFIMVGLCVSMFIIYWLYVKQSLVTKRSDLHN